MRGSGGVTFQFEVYAQGIGSHGPLPLETTLSKELNLSDWTALLKQMGAAEYFCVPLLLPKPGAGDPHAGAISYLRAQDFMLEGAYRATVASCRESLELLTNLHENASAGGPQRA